MLSFLKKLFGFGTTPVVEAPYKVEVQVVAEPVAEVAPAVVEKKPRAKKPAAPKTPRAKKAPKA
jgi:hypothetical protein